MDGQIPEKLLALQSLPRSPPRPSTREIHTRQVLWKSQEGPASNLTPVATFLLYVICLQPYSGLSSHLHFRTPVETNRLLLLHTWSIVLWEGDKGASHPSVDAPVVWSDIATPSSSPWSPMVILEVVSHHLCILYLKIIDLLIWPQYQLTVEQKLTWWFSKSCTTWF